MRFSPGSFFCITKTMPRIHYTKPSITELEVAYATDVAYNGSGSRLYEYITHFSGITL